MEVQALYVTFGAVVLMLAFAVRGGTGFGGATIAVPALSFVVPIGVAVSVLAVLSTINSIDIVRREWRNIAWSELRRLLPYSLAGVTAGLYLMATLDDRALRIGLGSFLVAYSTWALLKRTEARALSRRQCGILAAVTGTAGGFFAALFGAASGSIYAIYLNVRKLDKNTFRATVTSVMLVGLLIRIGGYAELGLYGWLPLTMIVAGLPMMFIGAWLGDRLLRNLDEKAFARLLACVIMVSGAGLLFS